MWFAPRLAVLLRLRFVRFFRRWYCGARLDCFLSCIALVKIHLQDTHTSPVLQFFTVSRLEFDSPFKRELGSISISHLRDTLANGILASMPWKLESVALRLIVSTVVSVSLGLGIVWPDALVYDALALGSQPVVSHIGALFGSDGSPPLPVAENRR